MSIYKYFSGTQELVDPHGLDNEKFAALFADIKGKRFDGFKKFVGCVAGNKNLMPVTRIIEYKSNPSLHVCGPRCRSAKGRSCECSCGGRYHGSNS